MWVQQVGRAGRDSQARNRLQGESGELASGQCASRGAGFRQRLFERGEIVLARMKFEISQQFSFLLGDFPGCTSYEFHTEPRGGRSQRIAFSRNVFRFDESFFLE